MRYCALVDRLDSWLVFESVGTTCDVVTCVSNW